MAVPADAQAANHSHNPFTRVRARRAEEERLREVLLRARSIAAVPVDRPLPEDLVRGNPLRSDLTTIATNVPANASPRLDGMIAAGIAGAAHGLFGFPVLTSALGIGAAVASIYLNDPDDRAIARGMVGGIAAVTVYRFARALMGDANA